MLDSIADFPLCGAKPEDLGVALGRSFAEFSTWHAQARLVAGFAQDARLGGVQNVLAQRLEDVLDFAEAEGLIVNAPGRNENNRQMARLMAEEQIKMADQGVKIAAIVITHNACERFLWRLVRFGLIGNRAQAIKWIAKRNVTVEVLIAEGVDAAVDAHLEKWWEELDRSTLLEKWDRLTGLVGFPSKLSCPPWHFDRDMLVNFDTVRHNAVHHDAQAVRVFDLDGFGTQLWRAQLVWVLQVASLLRIKIPAEVFFSVK